MLTLLILTAALALILSMATHTIVNSYSDGAANWPGATQVTDDGVLSEDFTFIATDVITLDLIITRTLLKSLLLSYTNPGAPAATCTVKTYASAVLKDTIVLTAGVPVMASNNTAATALLPTSDATSFTLTPSVGSGSFALRAIVHNEA